MVMLFASAPTAGDFAEGDTVENGGASWCEETVSQNDALIGVRCTSVVAVVATPMWTFQDIVIQHPWLEQATGFVGSDGTDLQVDYAGLIAGTVAVGFNDAVTSHFGVLAQQTYWWGEEAPGDQTCSGWSVSETGFGRARIFDETSGLPQQPASSCGFDERLLCACLLS